MIAPWGGDNSKVPHALQWAFHNIAEAMQKEQGFGSRRFTADERYPYIPLRLDSFEDLVKPLLKPRMHVIDVGCGAGDKLYSFHTLDASLRITGIEYDPTMAACAKYTCGAFASIICGDALQHDYAPYDLIYMYRPLVGGDAQGDLQERVMSTMRIGASLIVVFQQHVNNRTRVFFPLLDKGWVKKVPYDPEAGERYKGPCDN